MYAVCFHCRRLLCTLFTSHNAYNVNLKSVTQRYSAINELKMGSEKKHDNNNNTQKVATICLNTTKNGSKICFCSCIQALLACGI